MSVVPRRSFPLLRTSAGNSAVSFGSALIDETTSWVGNAVQAAEDEDPEPEPPAELPEEPLAALLEEPLAALLEEPHTLSSIPPAAAAATT